MRRTLLLALALACACQSRTELMIGIATDLPAPAMIDEIALEVSRADTGVPQQTPRWTLTGTTDPFNLPGSFAIVSDDGAPIDVTLVGLRDGTAIVSRRARLSLVEGETLFYRIGLTAACRDGAVSCPTGTTCVEGSCVAEEIPAAKLPDYRDDLVTQLSCRSGAAYVDTATGSAMPFSADAAACPFSLCSEGTCLQPPSSASVFKGVGFALPFDLILDGNTITVTVQNMTFTAMGSVTSTSFEGTTVGDEVRATIQGTILGGRAEGTIIVSEPASLAIPFVALASPATPYCGTFTRTDGVADPTWTFVTSANRIAGQYAGNRIDGDVFGTLAGTVASGALTFSFTAPGETGTAVGEITEGIAVGTLQGTADGRAFTGTFRASPQACLNNDACGGCPSGTTCVEGTCIGQGALRITLAWFTSTDVDLHVRTPTGAEIDFTNRMADTGSLDVDDTGGGSLIENVFFTTPPHGVYEIWAVNYNGVASTAYTLTIATPDQEQRFEGVLPMAVGEGQHFQVPYPLTSQGGGSP